MIGLSRLPFQGHSRSSMWHESIDTHDFIKKYAQNRGLHHTMRHDLHWLDMTDRIQFRIAVTVYRCLLGTAPEYLSKLFVPASTRSSRHCLRSSDSNKLVVPAVKLSTYGRRSFTASGPIVWNSLPEYLRDPTLSFFIAIVIIVTS